ncbi:TetR/AcrR family transcriptional regulator [Saccharothrix longispora]|uniref:TetR/AcrR family transcriptional regulator n=1 Tax=Saccharothrix longispora TaxID=33920 RepID=UPI0028FD76E7|nr:TetR family transcriptional regulator [Saccharothrix longispora]MBY8849892.1 TetR/AcrR family transcriptional regulator [Saccharothrix sp. MB29]MDU0291115.1 TetR family transcriptional regulator [Saccharothrix longispora]
MSTPTPSDTRPPLRERKKQRTREALLATGLRLFTERGFAATTLDELCDAVEISKRTFFRTFAGKEDVAGAPLHDLWTLFLRELAAAEPAGDDLAGFLRGVLLTALDGMTDPEWPHRVLLSRRLAERNPSIEAHCLYFCDRTTRAALTVLRERFDLPGDLPVLLALDVLVAVFHRAQEQWAQEQEVDAPGPATREGLRDHVVAAWDAVPAGLGAPLRPAAADRPTA